MNEKYYGFKVQAWEAKPWERAIMYISGYEKYYFTYWKDKGAESAWLSTGNRAINLDSGLFFSVAILTFLL